MRVATWNCAGAFRRKVDRALSLNADVTFIQEAENPAAYRDRLPPGDFFWFARPQDRKGVLVLTREGFGIRCHRAWFRDAAFHHVIPLKIDAPPIGDGYADPRARDGRPSGTGETLLAFVVWTLGSPSREAAYVGQAHLALDHYRALIQRARRPSHPEISGVLLAGDFNSNAFWDSGRRRNHSLLVERLASLGIYSAYHAFTQEAPGAEAAPTFYLYRHRERPYHLDYCFTDRPVRDVQVGAYDEWSGLKSGGGASDHVPLVVDIEFPARTS